MVRHASPRVNLFKFALKAKRYGEDTSLQEVGGYAHPFVSLFSRSPFSKISSRSDGSSLAAARKAAIKSR